MPNPRTGSIEPFRRADGSTYYGARIRHLDGFRERIDVPEMVFDPVAPLLAKVADNKRAAFLRTHLGLAEVARPRLLEDTATTMMVNFRSLRDSGITWEALAGTPVDRIQARAGHEHIATTLA